MKRTTSLASRRARVIAARRSGAAAGARRRSRLDSRQPSSTEVPMPQTVGRRAVLIGLAATLLRSPAHAQKPPPRIGWLSAGSEPDPFLDAFREGLQKLGYVEGQNVVLDIRHAHGNLEALRAGAAGVGGAQGVVIVASLSAVRAARAGKDNPLLFTLNGGPGDAGPAPRLSRPRRNLN